VIRDGCPSDLEDTDVVMLHLRDKLVDMDLEQLYRLELMTPEERMPAEREPATPTSRVCIVCNQNRVTVVCVDCDRIVVRSSKARIDHTPALMSALSEKRTDRQGVDVLIQHEAHLRDR
jgi:hypothetical protein